MGSSDEYHVIIDNPTDHLTWFEIAQFCKKTDAQLEDFVLHLDFGTLDD